MAHKNTIERDEAGDSSALLSSELQEEIELSGLLPQFLCEEEGRILTAMKAGSDVTKQYQEYLNLIKKHPETPPPFLRESASGIYLNAADDSDVTEDWREWVKTLP